MSMERYMFEEKRFQLQSMASAKINVDQILQTRILMSDLDIWLEHSENETPAQENTLQNWVQIWEFRQFIILFFIYKGGFML